MTSTTDCESEAGGVVKGACQGQTLDALLANNAVEDSDPASFIDALFLASAEATRHVWDTPEEDAAWADLQ